MKLAIVGKGGAGKSVLAGTLARVLARRGRRVLALDSDPVPGLTFSLGAEAPAEPPLRNAVQCSTDGFWSFIPGVGPVRAVQRYSTPAPDGVRLLQSGKNGPGGRPPLMAAINAFYMIIHSLGSAAAFREWAMLGDLPAGPRQTAYNWAPYAERFVLVAEPTWQSLMTARRIRRIASAARPGVDVSLVVSKATGKGDVERVGTFLEMPVLAAVPVDEGVRAAERMGVALVDLAPDCPAVRAIEQLTDRLQEHSLS